MARSFEQIAEELPGLVKSIKSHKETLLANLIMLGEIPAPTFGEERRIQFLMDRFKEAGIERHSVDQVGNGVGIIEGEENSKNILLVAHADTVFNKKTDHTIQIKPHEVSGPGIADNSLGLAVLATMPMLLEKLDIKLKHSLILMGATRSLGRGNLEGLRFFLSRFKEPIKAGIGIEGVELGRLSHTSIGMRRGEITCKIPEYYDWSRFGDTSAILIINDIINSINEIRLPKKPRTSIIFSSINGGHSFSTAKKATLQFEIRSESSQMAEDIHQNFREIINQVSSRNGNTIELDVFAKREPGGIPYTHPLVKKTRQIMDFMEIEPRPGPSTSELSSFIDRDIPAITLGLSHGKHVREQNESVQIEPIYHGIAQLLGTLQAVDGGFDDEN